MLEGRCSLYEPLLLIVKPAHGQVREYCRSPCHKMQQVVFELMLIAGVAIEEALLSEGL